MKLYESIDFPNKEETFVEQGHFNDCFKDEHETIKRINERKY